MATSFDIVHPIAEKGPSRKPICSILNKILAHAPYSAPWVARTPERRPQDVVVLDKDAPQCML